MDLVYIVNDLHDSLVPDYLLSGIYTQVVAIFQEDEVGTIPAEHHQVVDHCFLLGVEVLT